MGAQGMTEAERSARSSADETGEAAAAPARTRLTVALILGAGVLVSGLIAGGTAYVVAGNSATAAAPSATAPSARPSASPQGRYHNVANLCDHVDGSPLGIAILEQDLDDETNPAKHCSATALEPAPWRKTSPDGAAPFLGVDLTVDVLIAPNAADATANFTWQRERASNPKTIRDVGAAAFSHVHRFDMSAADPTLRGEAQTVYLVVRDDNLVLNLSYGATLRTDTGKLQRALRKIARTTLRKLAEA